MLLNSIDNAEQHSAGERAFGLCSMVASLLNMMLPLASTTVLISYEAELIVFEHLHMQDTLLLCIQTCQCDTKAGEGYLQGKGVISMPQSQSFHECLHRWVQAQVNL